MGRLVYMDNHATTRVDPRVVEVMVPLLTDDYGNASSRQHEFGWRAEAAVELARKRVAALVGGSPEEIVFTGGATESINIALRGVWAARGTKGSRVITIATEHRAVLDTCERLRSEGADVVVLGVDREGRMDLDALSRAMTPGTILVSVMTANNEIGVIHPIAEIGRLCRERGVLLHTDATQAVGKIPVDARAWSVDLMSFSPHKMHGPKGTGALMVREARPALRLPPLMDGGGQEKGLRPGTLNVPAIAGFGKAAELALDGMRQETERVAKLRDRLVDGLRERVPGLTVNGAGAPRIPQNANLLFPGASADEIMMRMKDIAVSSGAACSSASPEPSHVLRAIGLRESDAKACLRFGLGRFTTAEEIEYTITRVAETVLGNKTDRRQPVHAH
jgi:cysteine desulfurase